MTRSVVYILRLRPPVVRARHSAGDQRLTGRALGQSAQLTTTPRPGTGPGPDFIPDEPEAGA